MKVFLIILAVLFVLTVLILSLGAEFTVVYDNGWSTKVRVLFIEKDIELGKILSFILFPEKAAQDVNEERKEHKNKASSKKNNKKAAANDDLAEQGNDKNDAAENQKPNAIQNILNKDGVLGLMLFVSNLLQTAGAAISTLIKGLHIYSLYVKMIIGGYDAADIGIYYGQVCGIYYPLKGMILNGMKVDQYDDYVQPDFIAPSSEYEFQFIGSINVGLLLKVALKAGKVFVINLIKNK